MGNNLLYVTVFLVFALNVLTALFLVHTTDSYLAPTAQASYGEVQLCINAPPTITVPCNTTIDQDDTITCQLSASDLNSGQNLTFSAQWPGTPLFTINSSGYFSFTPDNDDVGSHSVLFIVDDNAGCTNSIDNETYNFTVTNINDPPYLVQNIPDVLVLVNRTTIAFSLNDYFIDPDGDVLTFTHTTPGGDFIVSLVGGTGVQIYASDCQDDEIIQFTAIDPYSLSADSNVVELSAYCPEDEEDGGGGDGDGDSSGGGGGGGASLLCEEEWNCLDWYPCLPTGYEWRHCFDLNGCSDTKFLKRECEYVGPEPECSENWLCSDWGPCYANTTQYRTCDDLTSCGSTIFRPVLEQKCTYLPTCEDGLKNGDEIGVDCGGSCAACPLIETPEFITAEKFNMWLLFAMLVGLLLTGGVLRLYHEEVMRVLRKLELLFSKRHLHEIWLTSQEKNILLEKLALAEQKVSSLTELNAGQKYELITSVSRIFLSSLSKTVEDATREEFIAGIDARKPTKELRALLISLFERTYDIEGSTLDYNEAFFYSFSEELRLYVCMLSEYSLPDIERKLVDFELKDDQSILDSVLVRVIRIYRALQFQQYDFAKAEYQELLKAYEDLPLEDQESMYDETTHSFGLLKYILEMS